MVLNFYGSLFSFRMKKPSQLSHPPMTSVTRRQNFVPAPPPKRRMSLEERLSPQLISALMSNPGARPKEVDAPLNACVVFL